MIDGEIIVADTERNTLDFEALQQRIHPAASRVKLLARADAGQLRRVRPARPGRRGPDRSGRSPSAGSGCSSRCSPTAQPPVHVTPATRDFDTAQRWFDEFEGAGPGRADRQAAGADLPAGQAGDDQDQAQADRGLRGRRLPGAQVGRGPDRLAAARPVRRARRAGLGRRHRRVPDGRRARSCSTRCSRWSPRSTGTRGTGPRTSRASAPRARTRTAGGTAGKDLSFVPLRPERVVEVRYDYMEGDTVPAHRPVRALASRPGPRQLHVRAAGTAGPVQPGRRAHQPLTLALAPLCASRGPLFVPKGQ